MSIQFNNYEIQLVKRLESIKFEIMHIQRQIH